MSVLLSPVTEAALSKVDATSVQNGAARRTVLVASLVGTTVEWYDFFLYATAATIVFNHAFFPSQSSTLGTVLAFATFAVGFVMRPIGGFVFGHIGDRIGRKRSLALTMLLMGGATALMGALPTAAQVGALAQVLAAVTVAALVMALLLPVSGRLTDRYGARVVYATGITAYALTVFPMFALFDTRNIVWFRVGMVVAFGVIHASFYGAQGTLYASLFPTRIRYTGLSTVVQLSGIYAAGLTPLILTGLIAAGHGTPWYACGYLVATAVLSVGATVLLNAR
jgi:MFS family permease